MNLSQPKPLQPRRGTRLRVSPAGLCFVLALLLIGAGPCRASSVEPGGSCMEGPASSSLSTLHAPPATLFASLSVSKFFSLSDRTNVVRVCVFVMALALFIMLKKFNEEQP
jgi:hypothetical protein